MLGCLLLGVGISIRAQRSVSAPPPLPTLDEIDPELARQFRAFSSAAAAQPSDPDRHGELGILYEAHGYRRLARACYENAVATDETRVRWQHHAGIVALAEGDVERAEQAFRVVIRYVPDYIPAYERLAYLRLERGAFTEARNLFATVVNLNPQVPQGYIGQAKVDLAMGRIESMVARLSKALEVAPTSGESHYLLGRAYQKLGRSWESEVELARGRDSESFLVYDPWHAAVKRSRLTLTARSEMAADWILQGRLEGAVHELELLRQRYPESTAVINNLSIAYRQLNRIEDAKRLLQGALDAGSNHPAVHLSLARVLIEQGRLEEALSHTDSAILLAPMLGPAYFTRGVILVQLRNYMHAVEAFREATRRDPGNPEANINIGRLLVHLNRFEEAENALRTAIAIAPQSAVARYELATVYQRQGRLEDAAENLEKAVRLDPNDEAAREALRLLRGARE